MGGAIFSGGHRRAAPERAHSITLSRIRKSLETPQGSGLRALRRRFSVVRHFRSHALLRGVFCADGIDADDEPFVFDFLEAGFEVLGIGFGLVGEARGGGEVDDGVGLFRADYDVDFVEFYFALELGARGEERLLKFGVARNGFADVRHAFGVDLDVRRENGEDAIDGRDAREIAFAGFHGEIFLQQIHVAANDALGRGMEINPGERASNHHHERLENAKEFSHGSLLRK